MDGGLLGALADLVLPRTCAGCGVPGADAVPALRRAARGPAAGDPAAVPLGLSADGAAGAYSGPVRPAVNAFKEQGRTELAGPLGAALALAVAAVVRAAPRAGAGAAGARCRARPPPCAAAAGTTCGS